jgi:protein-S-isoprenylcysteine O-methyltransferase Ste14
VTDAPETEVKDKRFWNRVAHRFSGRGRIRSVFVIASLIFSTWNPISAGIGLGVFIIGLVLHGVSKGNLVRNKQLCTQGPYVWVRHPFYVANFIIDISLCLMAGVPILAAVYAVAFPLAYLPRIFAEEEALRGYFGTAFDEYCKTTPRLLPRSIPRLIAWSRSSTFELMRLENELSRLMRLAAYPFFIAAVILGKRFYYDHEHNESLFAFCLAVALAQWAAGQLVHRYLEDGDPVTHPGVGRALIYGWIVMPILPLLQGRVPYAQLPQLRSEIQIAGMILLALGAILILTSRGLKFSGWEGLALTILALSCGLISGQIVLAPLLALLIWSGWFLSSQAARPTAENAPATSAGYPRLIACFGIMAFIVSFYVTLR